MLSELPLEKFEDDLVVDSGVEVMDLVRISSGVELDVEMRDCEETGGKGGKRKDASKSGTRREVEEERSAGRLTPLGEVGLHEEDKDI